MASPTVQGASTPFTAYTRGRLRELCLRSIGVSDAGSASPDTSLPQATAQEIAVMDGFVSEALTEVGVLLDRYHLIAETTVTADGDFTAVLLPADYGVILENGVHVSGYPVKIITTEEWLRSRRPTSEGGGTSLTGVSGEPASGTRLIGRIVPAAPASASVAKRMALFLYPVQTAAWTAEIAYRAVANAYGADTDTVRLPPTMFRLVRLFVSALWAEQRGDTKGAAERWALYRDARKEVENIAPSEEQGSCLVQGYPEDA